MNRTITLSQLLDRLPRETAPIVTGAGETHITGVQHDSRKILPGDLFVCLKGEAFDGHRFALEALESGASALAVQEGALAAFDIHLPSETPILTVADTRFALPLLSCVVYGDPSHELLMVGVTGTNGKTTTMRMVASILQASGLCVGTIGTLGSDLAGEPIASEHTTPEADDLQRLLRTMADRGAGAVVMEVSSHALAQYRTDGVAFNAAIFTNLTQDHLDYHKTMDAYFQAKARLFQEYPVKYPRPDGRLFASILNVGQWEGNELVMLAHGDILTFTTLPKPAVLTVRDVTQSADHSDFTAVYARGIAEQAIPIHLPVGGSFQVANALGALGAGLALGISPETAASGLNELPQVPGRFESVPTNGKGFSVIVDYAHTPDGLENVLKSARMLNPERIVCVFGCGGNRDTTKRPKMGRLAADLADIAIVTSDNPRHEDPKAIIDDILPGMQSDGGELREGIYVEPDRQSAITLAIKLAKPGDIVLLAGKGHETYQILGDDVIHFDDREVARELLS